MKTSSALPWVLQSVGLINLYRLLFIYAKTDVLFQDMPGKDFILIMYH